VFSKGIEACSRHLRLIEVAPLSDALTANYLVVVCPILLNLDAPFTAIFPIESAEGFITTGAPMFFNTTAGRFR
jgi:hypothetical protein